MENMNQNFELNKTIEKNKPPVIFNNINSKKFSKIPLPKDAVVPVTDEEIDRLFPDLPEELRAKIKAMNKNGTNNFSKEDFEAFSQSDAIKRLKERIHVISTSIIKEDDLEQIAQEFAAYGASMNIPILNHQSGVRMEELLISLKAKDIMSGGFQDFILKKNVNKPSAAWRGELPLLYPRPMGQTPKPLEILASAMLLSREDLIPWEMMDSLNAFQIAYEPTDEVFTNGYAYESRLKHRGHPSASNAFEDLSFLNSMFLVGTEKCCQEPYRVRATAVLRAIEDGIRSSDEYLKVFEIAFKREFNAEAYRLHIGELDEVKRYQRIKEYCFDKQWYEIYKTPSCIHRLIVRLCLKSIRAYKFFTNFFSVTEECLDTICASMSELLTHWFYLIAVNAPHDFPCLNMKNLREEYKRSVMRNPSQIFNTL